MATLYKKRGTWHIDYYIEGKRYSKNTRIKATRENRKDAGKIKKEIEDVISNKRYVVSAGKSVAFYVDVFRKEHLNLKSRSHQNVFKDALNNFLKIVHQDTLVEAVTSEHIAKYIEYLKPRVQNSTLLTYLNYMKIFFNFLLEEEIIHRNPIRKKQIPKRAKKDIVFFKQQMLLDILDTAKKRDPEYYSFLMMLLLTGQRPIDILGLRCGDVDFESNKIIVNISKTNKQIMFPLYDELKSFMINDISELHNREKDERIFSHFNFEIVRKRFMRIKRFLKINGKYVYTLKTFRKTFASYLAARGVDPSKIADLLGHDDVRTTKKYYAAVATENLRKELNKIFVVQAFQKSLPESLPKQKK